MVETTPYFVDPNDPALACEAVEYKGRTSNISSYLALPKSNGKAPAVLVIHAIRGINDHFRDVARRLAKEGFAALAPDLLSRDMPFTRTRTLKPTTLRLPEMPGQKQ